MTLKRVLVGVVVVGAIIGGGVLTVRWYRRKRAIDAGMSLDALTARGQRGNDVPPPRPLSPEVAQPPPKPHTFLQSIATPVLRVRQGFGRRYN